MNPLISVIIPIYNVEKYLARCVDSIVNQTYKNLEIILVDDGSPDRCPQMCDDYAKKNSRIKVVHKKNGGLSDARNAGIAVATGEYISFIDSDDWIDLETYDLVLEKMLATNSQIGAFNLKSVSDSNFKTEYNENYIVIDSQKAIENTIDNVNVRTVVWNKLYHRSVLENLSFRVGKLNEDEFFTFYALSNAQHIVYLFRQLYFYYQRPNSIMGTYSLKRLDMLDGVKERMEFVEKKYPEIYTKAKLSFCQCCIYQYQMLLRNKDVDLQLIGRKKVKKYRTSLKLSNHEIKNCRFIDKLSLVISNNSIGFELICRVRNIFNFGL